MLMTRMNINQIDNHDEIEPERALRLTWHWVDSETGLLLAAVPGREASQIAFEIIA